MKKRNKENFLPWFEKRLIGLLFFSLALVHCGSSSQKAKTSLPASVPTEIPDLVPLKSDRSEFAFTVNSTVGEDCKAIVIDPKACKDIEIQYDEKFLQFWNQFSDVSAITISGVCFPTDPLIIENLNLWVERSFSENSEDERLKIVEFYSGIKEECKKKFKTPPPWLVFPKSLKPDSLQSFVAHEYAHYVFGWENSKIKSALLPRSPLMTEEFAEQAIQDEFDEETNFARKYETKEKFKKEINIKSLIKYYSSPSEEFSYTFQAFSFMKSHSTSTVYDLMVIQNDPDHIASTSSAKEIRLSTPLFLQRYLIKIWDRAREWQKLTTPQNLAWVN